jgi:hypothetical protein
MTPEELETAVRTRPAAELTELLLRLTEPERKKLARPAVAIKRQAREELEKFYQSLQAFSSANTQLRSLSAVQGRADLAILAVGPWTDARRIPSFVATWGNERFTDHIYRILAARKPDWLERWVNKELESDGNDDWGLLRRLIREGLCPKPTIDQYIIKMVQRQAGCPWHPGTSLANHLRNDPGLLEDEVWRIFEVNPLNETLVQDMGADRNPWTLAFVELAAEGRLDRGRLLAASLDALARGLQPKNTGWFWKLHAALKPSVDERVELQPRYLKLLASPVAPVAGFALDALAEVARAKRLDAPGLVDAVPPTLHLRPKLQPMAALRLLKQAGEQEPALRPRIADVAAAALAHEKSEVQAAALSLIESESPREIGATLGQHLDSLAPSLQDRARKLLAKGEAAPSDALGVKSVEVSDPDALRAEAAAIPQPWRELAGIDAVLAVLDSDALALPAVRFDPLAIPRCYPDARLTPIHDPDELIERLSTAMEALSDPDEFELLLDGLSRCCEPRPEDFPARTAPLLHRIQQLVPKWGNFEVSLLTLGLRGALINLVRCWCDAGPAELKTEPDKLGVYWFLSHRVRELSLRIRAKRPAPLLGCPTHRHGWIEPIEFVRRLNDWRARGIDLDKHDLIQGLLRLAPEGREAARREAGEVPGEFGMAVRYALGSERETGDISRSLVLAAGRARQPRGELTELVGLLGAAGPDGASPATYQWSVRMIQGRYGSGKEPDLAIDPVPADSEPAVASRPTILLHSWKPLEFAHQGPDIRWVATAWPHQLDPFFAAGARALTMALEKPSSTWRPSTPFVEALLEPDTPFSEMAQLLLAVALVSRDAGASGLAVDVLIQACGDGRCVGPELGGVLGRLLAEDVVAANRLAKTLDTAARASPLHMHVCSQVVQTALAPLSSFPRDLHHLLGSLLEWLTALDQPLGGGARAALEKVSGGGKTKTLATTLLQRRGAAGKAGRQALVAEALRGRMERARRWMSVHGAANVR